jgi:hypothetical protein
MVPKFLAGLLAVAVLSVGGYTYWHYSDGQCCPLQAAANQLTTSETATAEKPSCCQQPSRTDCVNLSTADGCCEDIVMKPTPTPEVLDIPPREVK